MVPFAALLLATIPAVVPIPATDTAATRPRHRLSLAVEVGGVVTSLSSSLADQLRDAGYDDTYPGGCFFFVGCVGPSAYPDEQSPGVAAAITGRVAVTSSLLVSLGLARDDLGGARGYDEATTGSFGNYIYSRWSSRVLWGGAFWRPVPSLRLGGGPGWFRMTDDDYHTVHRAGLVLEAGAELPGDKLMFLSLTIRGHLIPTTDVSYGDVALRPSWSYLTIAAGLGFHLF